MIEWGLLVATTFTAVFTRLSRRLSTSSITAPLAILMGAFTSWAILPGWDQP